MSRPGPTFDAPSGRTATARFRLPALACSLIWLVCELIAKPFAEVGVADDWSYMRTAGILLHTGHVVYNGWATAMLGWQLYLGAAFMSVFGESYTSLRASTIFLSVITVFLLQRCLVRAGLHERNAALCTLALTLTPLYTELSATFMSDIAGLLTVLLCFYGCARALAAAPKSNARLAWLVFAAVENAVLGSCRQIAWLGVLAMVPCAVWLLRKDRRALIAGVVSCLASWAFIAWCLHWLSLQPYTIPEHLLITVHGAKEAGYMVRELLRAVLMFPYLMLAIALAFIPELRRASRTFLVTMSVLLVGYTALAVVVAHSHGPNQMLQPILGDWTGAQGFYDAVAMADTGPVILTTGIRLVLTALTMFGMFGMIAFVLRIRRQPTTPAAVAVRGVLSWWELAVLVVPFSVINLLLLIPRSATRELDRYLVEVVVFVVMGLVRAFQEDAGAARRRTSLPAYSVAAMVLIALYSVANLHDMFAFYRARRAIAAEFAASGRPANTLDVDWQWDAEVEIAHYPAINDEKILNPAHWYKPVDKYRGESCDGKGDLGDGLLHFEPYFGVAFSPTACAGAAPEFAPVSYTRWLGLTQTPLYIVKFTPRVPHPADKLAR